MIISPVIFNYHTYLNFYGQLKVKIEHNCKYNAPAIDSLHKNKIKTTLTITSANTNSRY